MIIFSIMVTVIIINIGAACGMLFAPDKTQDIIFGIPDYMRQFKEWCIDIFRGKE